MKDYHKVAECVISTKCRNPDRFGDTDQVPIKNKHSDTCIYLPPYKLDVLKIVKYILAICNTFSDNRQLLILSR